MIQSQRRTKKIIIATLYTLVGLIFTGSVVFSIWPKTPKPEVIVVEKPQGLTTGAFQSIPTVEGRADLVGTISNLNDQFGAEQVRYMFTLRNARGEQKQVTGMTFILPGERTKYVMELNYALGQDELVGFTIGEEYQWIEVSKFDLPELIVRGVDTGISEKAGNYFTLSGILTNQSNYSLKTIELVAIIEGLSGDITAVNKTFIRDVVSGEAREFEMTWEDPIPDRDIETITVYPYSNVLTNEEFLKRIGGGPVDVRDE